MPRRDAFIRCLTLRLWSALDSSFNSPLPPLTPALAPLGDGGGLHLAACAAPACMNEGLLSPT